MHVDTATTRAHVARGFTYIVRDFGRSIKVWLVVIHKGYPLGADYGDNWAKSQP
jgi:hypothetical protein